MKLFCVRHGTTTWTDQARYTGTSNPALTEHGQQEAEAIAQYLSGTPFEAMVSSPLRRCYTTAESIQKASLVAPPDQLVADARAQEIFYGDWEGRTRDEILADDPEAFAWWDTDPTQQAPPGGESVADVEARVDAMLEELLAAHAGRVLLVSHRTVLRILVARALGMPLKYYRQRLDHAPAALTIVDLVSPREGKLILYNFKPPLVP